MVKPRTGFKWWLHNPEGQVYGDSQHVSQVVEHVQLVLGDCSVDSIANVDQGVDALQVDVWKDERVVTDAFFFSLLFVV